MKPDRIRQFVGAVRDFWKANGYAPSYEELRVRLEFSSVSIVSYWLRRSWALGLLSSDFRKARTVRLTDRGRRYLEEVG